MIDLLTWHNVLNLWVLVTSTLAVWAVARTDRWHRWGYVFGLLSEPGWFYFAWLTQSWGVMLLTIWWTWSWGQGAWRRFGCDVVH